MSITQNDFPKKIYVWIDDDGDEKFMMAEKTPEECAIPDKDRLVGIYNLEGVATAVTSVTLR